MGKAVSYIRFSTKSQGKEGKDSLRRQIEATAAYCAAQNPPLELDEDLRDPGWSAYTSKHIKAGALGGFLERLDSKQPNRIPADSTLIIEAKDRLNRATPREALPVFLDIINAGVTIVSLRDGQRYDMASTDANMGQLYMSIGLMFGAHADSQNKSARVSELECQTIQNNSHDTRLDHRRERRIHRQARVLGRYRLHL